MEVAGVDGLRVRLGCNKHACIQMCEWSEKQRWRATAEWCSARWRNGTMTLKTSLLWCWLMFPAPQSVVCFFHSAAAVWGTSRSSSSSTTSSRKLHQLCFSIRTNGDEGLPGIIEGQRPRVPPENPAPWLDLGPVKDLSDQPRNIIHRHRISRRTCKKRFIAASANEGNNSVIWRDTKVPGERRLDKISCKAKNLCYSEVLSMKTPLYRKV